MPTLDLLILALVQGVTEFLPISSSGHLQLWPMLTGRTNQGLAIDVAVHVGTLVAVVLYFRADVAVAVRGGFRVLRGDFAHDDARLALLLVAATVPVIVAGGLLWATGWEDALRSLPVIAWATLIGGALLWFADRGADGARADGDWRFRDAVLMGVAQAFALIPGMSRSGVTFTAARALGYDRVSGAKLSMLMSIPTIIAAGALVALDLAKAEDPGLGADAALAAALAFLAAYAAIAGLMRMMRTWTMTPFVVYRLILGLVLLYIVYG